MPAYTRYEHDFFTATILEWKPLLTDDKYKDIIISSLKFLVENNRVFLNAFVIMNNHIHIIWQIAHPHIKEDVQRDFMKYTSQMMIKDLRNANPGLLERFRVNAKDRKYQVWERNALSVPLQTESVLMQKVAYIHNNPVRKSYCEHTFDYKYSSAGFYETGVSDWDFLTHYKF